jgi:hypothetical protein
MAQTNTEIGVKIKVDGKDAVSSVGSIKAQLKEANAELIRMRDLYGDTSKEAIESAKRVGELKDRIGDAKAMADSFNPDAKFTAFAGAIQSVVGGFSAVTGAMALFGSQNEKVEETLKKVQGALALSQGINSILEAKDSFKTLGAMIKNTTAFQSLYNASTKIATIVQTAFGVSVEATSVGFKVLRGAIMSTGIGALVVGIGALVNKVMEWTESTDSQKDAEERLKREEQNLQNAIDETNQSIERRNALSDYSMQYDLKMAESRGATTKELRQIEDDYYNSSEKGADGFYKGSRMRVQQQRDESVEDYKRHLNELLVQQGVDVQRREEILNNYYNSAIFNSKEFYDGLTDSQKKFYDIYSGQMDKSEQAFYKENQKYKLVQANREKEDYDKRLEQQRKFQEKQKELADKMKQANEQLEKENRDVLNQIAIEKIKDEDAREKEKLNRQFLAKQQEIEQSSADGKHKNELLTNLKIKLEMDIDKITNDFAKKRKEKSDADAKELADANQKALDDAQALADENFLSTIANENDREKAKIELEYARRKDEIERLKISEFEKTSLLNQLSVKRNNDINAVEKKASEERIQIQIAEKERRAEIVDAVGNIAVGLANLLKSANEKSKGLAIASLVVEQASAVAKIITNTAVANAKSVAQFPLTGGQPWVAINTISAGVSIASAIASTIKGIQQIRGANENSSTSGGGTGLSGGGTLAPMQPQLETTTLNQSQINQLSNASARAFVLESDVSGQQERIRRLNRASRIN